MAKTNKQLSHEDARAVDLYLNGGHGADGEPLGSTFVNHGKGHTSGRLDSVERVLRLIGQMPAPEPPSDLLSRTLARLDEAGAEARIEHRAATSRSATGGARPHA